MNRLNLSTTILCILSLAMTLAVLVHVYGRAYKEDHPSEDFKQGVVAGLKWVHDWHDWPDSHQDLARVSIVHLWQVRRRYPQLNMDSTNCTPVDVLHAFDRPTLEQTGATL